VHAAERALFALARFALQPPQLPQQSAAAPAAGLQRAAAGAAAGAAAAAVADARTGALLQLLVEALHAHAAAQPPAPLLAALRLLDRIACGGDVPPPGAAVPTAASVVGSAPSALFAAELPMLTPALLKVVGRGRGGLLIFYYVDILSFTRVPACRPACRPSCRPACLLYLSVCLLACLSDYSVRP
jgi:hypothetical protein